MKRVGIIIVSIGVALSLSVVVDRVLGSYLNRTGYFKAFPSSVTIHYDAGEFDTIATISAQGVRNPLVTMPKPKGTYRILAVGDSFTYGWGVTLDQGWVKLVESRLQALGLNVEVINAGIPGAGAIAERQTCMAYADYFNVDAIIWGVYSDDFYQATVTDATTPFYIKEAQDFWPTLMRLNQPVIDEPNAKLVPAGTVLTTAEGWKEETLTELKKHPLALMKLAPNVRQMLLAGKLNMYTVFRPYSDSRFLFLFIDTETRQRALEAFRSRIAGFVSECQGSRPTVAIYMPGPAAVSRDNFQYKLDLGYDVDPQLVTFDRDKYIKPLFDAQSITYVSVTASFRTDGCPDCFFNYDGHLTAKGNSRVADVATPVIAKTFFGKITNTSQ